MNDDVEFYIPPHHKWYDPRNWRLWASTSGFLLVVSVAFALITTTHDRDKARTALAAVSAEQRCRSKAASAVSAALIDKIIDIGDVQDVIGAFVIEAAGPGQADMTTIVARLGTAIADSEKSGTNARRAVDAQRDAVAACQEAQE
jgi:hypothetical protein